MQSMCLYHQADRRGPGMSEEPPVLSEVLQAQEAEPDGDPKHGPATSHQMIGPKEEHGCTGQRLQPVNCLQAQAGVLFRLPAGPQHTQAGFDVLQQEDRQQSQDGDKHACGRRRCGGRRGAEDPLRKMRPRCSTSPSTPSSSAWGRSGSAPPPEMAGAFAEFSQVEPLAGSSSAQENARLIALYRYSKIYIVSEAAVTDCSTPGGEFRPCGMVLQGVEQVRSHTGAPSQGCSDRHPRELQPQCSSFSSD